MRVIILLAFLSGCGVKAPSFPQCPAPVAIPAPAPPHPTHAQENVLEIRVELAREAERARGDACAEAVAARDAWIGTLK